MNTKTIKNLQFDEVKSNIATYAISEIGKEAIQLLNPSLNKKQIEIWLQEVEEAKAILKISSSVPIHGLKGMSQLLNNLHKGFVLNPEQLKNIYELLICVDKLKRFMKDKEYVAPIISTYVFSFHDLNLLMGEIGRCIRNGRVDDYASKALLKTRKQISVFEERIKNRIEQIMNSSKYNSYLQDKIVSVRNGHYVIPIKKEYRKNIKGNVYDTSASGSTIFIEPEEISALHEHLDFLKTNEEIEVEQILIMLTGLVEKHEHEIKIAVETMKQYDLIFAKAKYSLEIRGTSPIINKHHEIKLRNARHPLLGNDAVPLTLEIGESFDALVITGPNTGGKTVTVKTVGLLTLMAQSGIQIPTDNGSEILSLIHI